LADETWVDELCFQGKRSIFGQAFRQLNHRDPKMFRLEKSKCAWKTVFKGEFADDYGGPYRSSIEDMCKELQSNVLPLLIRCPNGRENIGSNREKYVPRPSSTSALHLSMYEFVGKLMGLAIRTRTPLDLDFPSIVWKPLVGDVVTEEDVLAIDLLSFKILGTILVFIRYSIIF
jgi:E3 ubiquitin-protein ligase HERC2